MKRIFILFVYVLPMISLMSCGSDDDSSSNVVSKTYFVNEISNSGVTGTVKFIENADNSITAEINLEGTTPGEIHPAHIHFNSALETGAVAVTLGDIDGNTGTSTITFSTLNDDTPITFEMLLDFDGYINIHQSVAEIATIIGQVDIGENELTGLSMVYTLNEVDVAGISGTLTLEQRKNNETLATIALLNTPNGGSHPAHIHNGSVENAPGQIVFTFTPVNGNTGLSKTNITALDDMTTITYDEFDTFDGYVNVHASAMDLGTLVAQGDIGVNTLQ